jgi:hypothetical protein
MTMAMDRSLPNRMIRAARLDSQLYEEVENDESATSQAAIVVVIAAISGAIGAFIRDGIGTAIIGLVGALIGWFLWSAITLFVGRTFFGTDQTNVDLGEMLRALGFSTTPGILSVLNFIPVFGVVLSLVLGIWQLIAGVIAVRQAMDFSTGRAIATVIVGWIVQVIFAFFLGLLLAPFIL